MSIFKQIVNFARWPQGAVERAPALGRFENIQTCTFGYLFFKTIGNRSRVLLCCN